MIKKFCIDKQVIGFLYMREVLYLYTKKKILKKLKNEKIEIFDTSVVDRKNIKIKHLKISKYIIMKLLKNRLFKKMIVKGDINE